MAFAIALPWGTVAKTYHLKTTTVSWLSGNVIVANSDYSLSHNKTALNTFIRVAGKPHDYAVKPRPAPHALPWLAAAREFPSTPPPFYIVPDKYLVGSCASCCWNVAAVTVTPQTKEKVKHFFPQKKQKQVYVLQAAGYDSESPFGVLLGWKPIN